jgi:alkaline phosphatase D
MLMASMLVVAAGGCGTTPPRMVGPLVGHVTDTEANVWAWAGPEAEFLLTVEPAADGAAGAGGAAIRPVAMVSDPERHDAATGRATGLQPSTTYHYTLARVDESAPLRSGTFTTAPPRGEPARFTMAAASCMKHREKQSTWKLVLAARPAFQVLVGDTHYANTTDYETIWRHNVRYRAVPAFAAVIRDIPTYAIWDDHDYAWDNADRFAPGKADSLRAFTEAWPNPGAGTEDIDGAFFAFSWGDVDFFVLDGRYHRDPNGMNDDDQKRLLGAAQFAWLEAGLQASNAPFKVIVCGSTLMKSWVDGWRRYDHARQRLFDMIMDGGIEGVLFITGDVHRCLLEVHPPEETGGYTLYEVISSGITRGRDRGFVTLTFDTTAPDPVVRVRIIHKDGDVVLEREIRASELRL